MYLEKEFCQELRSGHIEKISLLFFLFLFFCCCCCFFFFKKSGHLNNTRTPFWLTLCKYYEINNDLYIFNKSFVQFIKKKTFLKTYKL